MLITGEARISANDSAQLHQLIVSYFDGVATKNFEKLKSVSTEDFVIYEDGKIWNNDSVFRNIQYNQPFTVKFLLTGFRVFADNRSGFCSYHSNADFVIADSIEFILNFIETATFRKIASGWKISMIHVTQEKTPEVHMPSLYRSYDTVKYIPDHYRERIDLFRSEPMSKGGIIILGNSITEYGDWKVLFNDSRAINRGIAGDNTFGMLERLQEVIDRKPAKLFIEAGINDIGQGVLIGLITANIESIVGYVKVKSPGTKIYVLSVLPTNENAKENYPQIYGKNKVVHQVNQQLQQNARTQGFIYLDLASRLEDGSGNLITRYAQQDGLHLNKDGYASFISLLKEKGYF